MFRTVQLGRAEAFRRLCEAEAFQPTPYFDDDLDGWVQDQETQRCFFDRADMAGLDLLRLAPAGPTVWWPGGYTGTSIVPRTRFHGPRPGQVPATNVFRTWADAHGARWPDEWPKQWVVEWTPYARLIGTSRLVLLDATFWSTPADPARWVTVEADRTSGNPCMASANHR